MINQSQASLLHLPKDLQVRLDVVVDAVKNFWDSCPHYPHYTLHGTLHSGRVYQNLAQLVQGNSVSLRLTDDEVLIVSAAAWLYDIGMQCPDPKAVLGFETKRGKVPTLDQLESIRTYKHALTYQMILESVSVKPSTLDLGFSRDDDYTQIIADICRWISDVPLDGAPEILPAYGRPVRVSLLVVLLRLADQLYIDRVRLNADVLLVWELSPREKNRWLLYLYTKALLTNSTQIRFYYLLPENLRNYLNKIRALFETEFDYIRNSSIHYLWDKYRISLTPSHESELGDFSNNSIPLPDAGLIEYLNNKVASIEDFSDRGFPEELEQRSDNFDMKNYSNVPQIFISYTKKNKENAEEIYQKLTVAGFKPWMDIKDLLPGEEWSIAIPKAIRSSDFFLAIFSKESVGKRGYLQRELKHALDIWEEMLEDDIYFIPVRLDECDIPDQFRRFQWLDLFDSNGYPKLIKAISVGYKARAQFSGDVVSSEFTKNKTLNQDNNGDLSTVKVAPKQPRKVTKILFLAANPSDTSQLMLDEEIRSIDQALRMSDFRDEFVIESHWAVRVSDLQEYLLRHKPDIVHFSGHGSSASEIILKKNNGKSQPVSAQSMGNLFSIFRDNIRCVVLNACFSTNQADAIARHIDCVVGMTNAIGDQAAISFASAFYRALGYGKDIKTAFDSGCVEIDIESLDEQDTPKLYCVRNNPKDIVFVDTSK